MKISGIFPIVLLALVSCGKTPQPSQPSEPDKPVEPEVNDSTAWYFDSEYTGKIQDGTLLRPFSKLESLTSVSIDRDVKLKCGSTFKGGIRLENIDSVTLTSYGEGDKPRIDGNNIQGSAIVYVRNCSNLTVSNLELYDSNATARGDKRGVLIDSDPDTLTTYSNITVENIYIHDIYGELDEAGRGGSAAAKKCGGIHVWTTSGFGRYDNLLIRGNRIKSIDCNGISTWYKPGTGSSSKVSPYSADFQKYAYTNVRITGNEISDTGKNSLFIRNVRGGRIDHNIWYDNSYRCHAGNALCTSYVDGIVVEYNEGFLNRANINTTDGKGYQDGCMLDSDLQSRNVVFQYNLSHDNTFGLFLDCDAKSATDPGAKDSIIVRYNLSINDRGTGKGIFHVNYYVGSLEMYNNTVITRDGESGVILFSANKDRGPYRFFNNLIYDRSSSSSFYFEKVSKESGKFSDNCYWSTRSNTPDSNFKSLNQNGIYSNPMLKGEIPADTQKIIGIENVNFGLLEAGSPCLGAGREVTGVAVDFFGNICSKSIGCCGNAN